MYKHNTLNYQKQPPTWFVVLDIIMSFYSSVKNGTNAVSIFVLKKVLERNLLHYTVYYLKQKD